MIGGLPLTSWILIVLSVSLGFAIELRYYRAYRRSVARAWTESAPPDHG